MAQSHRTLLTIASMCPWFPSQRPVCNERCLLATIKLKGMWNEKALLPFGFVEERQPVPGQTCAAGPRTSPHPVFIHSGY